MPINFSRASEENNLEVWLIPDFLVEAIRTCDLVTISNYCKSRFSWDEKKKWGAYYNTYESPNRCADPKARSVETAPIRKEKFMVINPGELLTPQVHLTKLEHWTALTDNVTFDSGPDIGSLTSCRLPMGENVTISANTVHRLLNRSSYRAFVYEVQIGYCHEDDVVRFEDHRLDS